MSSITQAGVKRVPTDAGTAIPSGGSLTLTGAGGITTSAVGSTVTITGIGALAVETLTGNSGGAVGPTANNINIVGNGTDLTVTGNPGTSTLTVKNLRDVGRYVVSPIAGQATYTSIQTAINQAVTDGASAANPAIVWLWSGTYTENITLAPFVGLASKGDTGVKIVGNAIFTPSIDNDSTSCHQISFQTPLAGGASFDVTGINICRVDFDGCDFNGTTGPAFSCTNAAATVRHFNSQFIASAGFKAFDITDCTFVFNFNAIVSTTDTPSTVAGTGQLIFVGSIVRDNFVVTGTATLASEGSAIVPDNTTEIINIGAGASSILNNIIIQTNAASGFWATGTGNIIYNSISPSLGSAIKVNPTLTTIPQLLEIGNLSFDGGNTSIASDGQLIIGNTGGQPTISTLTPGTGISISNGSGSITISTTGTTTLNYTPVNTTPYVVLTTDDFLGVDSSGAPITIELPNAPATGRAWVIKDITASAASNNITVTTVGGAVLIDGSTSFAMNTNYESITVLFSGSAYYVF